MTTLSTPPLGRGSHAGRAVTTAQRELLAYILAEVEAQGRPPTLRDMCRRFGWTSTNAAHGHLVKLERRGYVEHTPGINRGWAPTAVAGVWLTSYTPEHGELARRLRAVWARLLPAELRAMQAVVEAAERLAP